MAANIQPIQSAVGQLGWGVDVISNGFEAGSQSFKAGTLLIPSSGLIAIAGANPTTIMGVSVAAASGVTNTAMQFVPTMPDVMWFKISVDGALNGGNAPGTGKPSDFTLYSTYGVSLDTASGIFYLDSSKSGANQVARVMQFRDGSRTGGTVVNDYVYINWLRTNATIYI